MVHQIAAPRRCLQYTTVIDPRHASRLVPQERLDSTPLEVVRSYRLMLMLNQIMTHSESRVSAPDPLCLPKTTSGNIDGEARRG